MYKEGDKIKLIEYDDSHNISFLNFTLGEVLIVTRVHHSNNNLIYIKESNGRKGNWYVPIHCVEPFKKKPMTEIDYLDSFQYNFKEGV